MHPIIENGLEDYLGGHPNREFEVHVAQCLSCQKEIAAIQRTSGMLSSFKSDAPPSPPLGFQTRVMRRVADQKASSIWGVFTMDPGFARKLAFGSLLSLAALGGYLFTATEDSMAQADHTPEAVMASHDASSPDQQQHLDGMFLTLATYHQ
jgi:hypothetical protein